MSKKKNDPSQLEDPPEDFCKWWYPHRRDHESGADIGGHPDAERIWARKDPGRWVRRTYGTTARIAWNALNYQSEYLLWVEAGRPEKKDFISLAATKERQKEFYKDFKPLFALFASGAKPEQVDPLVATLMEKYPGHDPTA